MTIIDVLAALEEGAFPTNEQLLAFLNSIRQSPLLSDRTAEEQARLEASKGPKEAKPFLDRRALSDETVGVIDELGGLLDALSKLIEERNPNEEIQEALWRSRGAARAALVGLTEVKKEGGKKVANALLQDGKDKRKKEKEEKQAKKLAKKGKGNTAVKKMNQVRAEGKQGEE